MDDAIRFHNHQSAGHLRQLVDRLLELQPAKDADAAARARFTINHLQCSAEHVRELHLVELGSPPPTPRPAAAAVSSASPITVLGESHTALLRAAQDQGQEILALWSPEAFEAGRRLDLKAMAALDAALDALLLTLDALLEVTRALHHALDPLDALAEAEAEELATPLFEEVHPDAASLTRCPRCGAALDWQDRTFTGTYCEGCRSAWLVPEVG
jgi:hypothetical protein